MLSYLIPGDTPYTWTQWQTTYTVDNYCERTRTRKCQDITGGCVRPKCLEGSTIQAGIRSGALYMLGRVWYCLNTLNLKVRLRFSSTSQLYFWQFCHLNPTSNVPIPLDG